MRWYERLYVGEKAKKDRYSIIKAVRDGKYTGYYILTPPSNERNLLDIFPAITLQQPYYKERDLLILGIAADERDAALLAGQIVNEVLQETGGYNVVDYLLKKAGEMQD